MKKLVSVAAIAAAMLATPAMAAQFNGSVGYTAFNEDSYNVDLGAITARFGVQLTPNFGLEAEGSFGTSEGDVTESFSRVEVSLNHLIGLYAVASYPFNDSFEIFGRIGVSTAEAEAKASTTSAIMSGPPNNTFTTITLTSTATESGSGGEIGVGARYFFAGGNHGIRGDVGYSDTLGATALSIGYAFRFGGE